MCVRLVQGRFKKCRRSELSSCVWFVMKQSNVYEVSVRGGLRDYRLKSGMVPVRIVQEDCAEK